VPIDAVSGLPAGAFPKVDGEVHAIAADGTGGWYIGGIFTLVGTAWRNSLAHVLADGTVDPDWNPSPSANSIGGFVGIFALAVSGPFVYIG
jgi:hypothetical protein